MYKGGRDFKLTCNKKMFFISVYVHFYFYKSTFTLPECPVGGRLPRPEQQARELWMGQSHRKLSVR